MPEAGIKPALPFEKRFFSSSFAQIGTNPHDDGPHKSLYALALFYGAVSGIDWRRSYTAKLAHPKNKKLKTVNLSWMIG